MRVAAPSRLEDEMATMASAVDRQFDLLLAVPDDQRARLYEAMRHAGIGGGKRLRPLLVKASCDLFNVSEESAVRAGLAVECIHVYSLVHDDLPAMDNDDMRRGKPTVHRAFDEATAILAGDCLHDLAYSILVDERTHPDPFARCELVKALALASGPTGMAGGQMMDLVAETGSFDLSTITRLQQLKTGALIGFCVEAGSIMARVKEEGRNSLRGYARDLGLAFQIADDLLDVEGSADVTGKAVGKDAAAGKGTFVSLMGVERAREQARMLVEQAKAHLSGFGAQADLLRDIADFAILPVPLKERQDLMRIGLYPGTFDPITLGHMDIIRRGAKLVDKLVIGVTTNPSKSPLFTLDERLAMVRRECADMPTEIEVVAFDTLLIDFARSVGASLILRGLRAVADFEYEYQMAGMNQYLDNSIETVFLMADVALQPIASRLVKEIAYLGGDISKFVTPPVRGDVLAKIDKPKA